MASSVGKVAMETNILLRGDKCSHLVKELFCVIGQRWGHHILPGGW